MLQPWHIWVIIALISFIIEIFTSGFAIACLSVGGLAAAVASAFNIPLIWQIVVFAVFTLLAFIFVRPAVQKYFFKSSPGKKTNVDALVGKRGRVSSDIDPAVGYGRVAIDGDDWKAVSADGNLIGKGQTVEVVSVDSIILTVKTI